MSQRKIFDNLFDSGKLNRRDFMQGAAAFGITATAASTMWSKKAAASPKKGGHFRMGMGSGSTSDSMDPGQLLDTYQTVFNFALRNTLVDVDHKNNAIPQSRVRISSDVHRHQHTNHTADLRCCKSGIRKNILRKRINSY